MENQHPEPVSMLRFVLAYSLVTIAAGVLFAIYASATGKEAPISSTPVTFLAVGAAVFWYIKTNNRRMLGSEILWFSIGNALVDFVVSVAWLGAMVWLAGASFTWEGLSTVLGGGPPHVAKISMIIGLAIGLPQVALISAFLAWLMTRRLPTEAEAQELG